MVQSETEVNTARLQIVLNCNVDFRKQIKRDALKTGMAPAGDSAEGVLSKPTGASLSSHQALVPICGSRDGGREGTRMTGEAPLCMDTDTLCRDTRLPKPCEGR